MVTVILLISDYSLSYMIPEISLSASEKTGLTQLEEEICSNSECLVEELTFVIVCAITEIIKKKRRIYF